MTRVRIAIIGMGPRGVTILERLAEHAGLLPPGVTLDITAYDPGASGEGSHPSTQSDRLLTNTVASQVTIFAPGSRAFTEGGLSFHEWARSISYRLPAEDRGNGLASAKLSDADHLPRALLGAYLGWAYRHIAALLPDSVNLSRKYVRIADIIDRNGTFTLLDEAGEEEIADFVFITTGHGFRQATGEDEHYANFAAGHADRNPNLRYYSSPYPIHALDAIAPEATVAIQGFGLTAHDVIAALTLGRGGRYERSDGLLRYRPSGNEPRMLLFSRNCLPFAARGINQKGLTGRHVARFFTPDEVRRRRAAILAATGEHQLDFEKALLPIVLKEMAYAHRLAAEPDISHPPEHFIATPEERAAVEAILWPLREQRFGTFDAFRAFFYGLIESDLAEAEKGNVASAVKAATDALRDIREGIREAVEYAGLTPASHRYFLDEFNAITNRVSFGPPKRRNYELLALRDAGLLDIAGGPGSRLETNSEDAAFHIVNRYDTTVRRDRADILVVARLDPYSPLTDNAPLTRNLLQRGLIRPHFNGGYHPGGIDIDDGLHPIGQSGTAHPHIWALGFPVEGPHFYTHALPRPEIPSRQTRDADRCVRDLIGQLPPALIPAASAEEDQYAQAT